MRASVTEECETVNKTLKKILGKKILISYYPLYTSYFTKIFNNYALTFTWAINKRDCWHKEYPGDRPYIWKDTSYVDLENGNTLLHKKWFIGRLRIGWAKLLPKSDIK